jgi:hypothetical protein
MKVAFIYNPYQLLIVVGLIKSGVIFQRLIIPQRLEKLTRKILTDDKMELILLKDAYVSVGTLKKILANVNNFRMYKKLECDELYIANDQSILFLAATKLLKIGIVTLIDEGALAELIIREKFSVTKFGGKFKRVFLGCRKRGLHPKIANMIVNDPSHLLWDEFRATKKISNGDIFVNLALDSLSSLAINKQVGNSTIIATSPLTENKNSSFENQELRIIIKLLESNPHKNFVLKMHYREILEKYKTILSNYKNVELIDSLLNELPLQLLFQKFEYLIGFHSSVVTQYGILFPGKALSLSGMVGSEHAQQFVMTKPSGVVFLDEYSL